MMRNEYEAVVEDDRRLLDLPEHLLRKTAIVNVIPVTGLHAVLECVQCIPWAGGVKRWLSAALWS